MKTEDQNEIVAIPLSEEELSWFDVLPDGHEHDEATELEMKQHILEQDTKA